MKKNIPKSLLLVSIVLAIVAFAACTPTETFNVQEPLLDTLQSSSLAIGTIVSASQGSIVELDNEDTYEMRASAAMLTSIGDDVMGLAYNNMVPGPILKVKQGSNITVNFKNDMQIPTTVHWHGLRHDIKFDGVPGVTQDPIEPGESFTYKLFFPDAGVFWYHPHIREDLTQDLGLAGNMIVIPANEIYNPVNREEVLMLDDIYLQNGQVVPYGEKNANFALMGRYGNKLLVNGKEDYQLEVSKGEVVRFYITNVANVRPFNFSISGAKLKLVGSDLGLYEKETFVDSVVIAPAERYIVEAFFDSSGNYNVLNSNPIRSYILGSVQVSDVPPVNDYSEQFGMLSSHEDLSWVDDYLDTKPDHSLVLSVDTFMMMGGGHMGMAGMPCHRMPDGSMMGDCDGDEGIQTIEWEDTMFMMNYNTNSQNTKWVIHDQTSGLENMDLKLKAEIGDKVKVRIFNDPMSMHPMQHPIHLHGQRFAVIAIDGKKVENRVWKDTVLVPIESTVDILVDVTNPGEWMLHCHIAEHLEAGMMSSFVVGNSESQSTSMKMKS